uniref:Uncharacterized protein n=1 Tax=Octopus bimaculoides TaxID=37653 RepID=A0A0L8HMN1_OCTBM
MIAKREFNTITITRTSCVTLKTITVITASDTYNHLYNDTAITTVTLTSITRMKASRVILITITIMMANLVIPTSITTMIANRVTLTAITTMIAIMTMIAITTMTAS